MTGTTAADYLWFGEDFDDLAEAYCVTLVRGLSPRTLLARLGAEDEVRVTGVQALIEPAYDACDTHDGDRLFVGVTAVGDWALMVEPNGWLGVTDEAVAPISRGTTVVPHFRNINAVDHFNWFEDGELRLHFEPLFPYGRDGSDPDGLVDTMRKVGFDLSEGGGRDYALHTEATFAPAERITGVLLTPELLRTSEFVCGTVPIPDH
ncbi:MULTISPECIES: DUF6461 domain-containing protein [unclassified Streptomyces]|uniref:DUF6461 domain-containing protein n=1 Tax=unclassified Streptomyces TaxID=2593676 RepID=UPI002DDBE1D0|nr:DUF6461 domain-containing protein [Streptomyces sp. NBC_01750]WSB03909.1 DUF6461 domain-containing protein [Streptomyces sp. NBC_01794]WSD31804.1 DUF6461 domain-containing protein [Streptomyces sp. NBC_01750]